MTEITLQQLKDMNPGTIFASGVTEFYSNVVHWVAIRGGIHDWAIYYKPEAFAMAYSDRFAFEKNIAEWGDKIHDVMKIKELVPCDEQAFAMYRH